MTVNNIKLVRAKSQTLTAAVEHEIRTAIITGIYRPSSQLPAEPELMKMLGVSRTVVREALRALEDDGLIIRRHGIGTFVRKHPITQYLSFNFGTTEMIKSSGMVPGTAHLEVMLGAADGEVANALNLPIGAPVLVLERIRTADGKPVVYSLDYVPRALVGDLDVKTFLKTNSESLYQFLQTSVRQVIEYGLTRILPVNAPVHIAGKLQVPEGSVLLHLQQTDYSPTDEPLLYSREFHVPDAFDFVIMRRGPKKTAGAGPPSLTTSNGARDKSS